MKIENKQRITKIKYSQKFYGYCPLGKENYAGTLEVEFVPGDYIPDYCDETDYIFNTYNQCELIGEDVVDSYYNHLMKEYSPVKLMVRMLGETSKHFPVSIEKNSEEL